MTDSVRIIGLDPGLRYTGWGVIDAVDSHLSHVAHGVVKSTQKAELSYRLCELYQELTDVIQQFTPDEAVVEETFVNKNPNSTLKLGMARGVILLTPALQKLTVAEYTANQIKKAVVGVGHAAKEQVEMMVATILPAASGVKADAADALAAAITHAHFRRTNNLIANA